MTDKPDRVTESVRSKLEWAMEQLSGISSITAGAATTHGDDSGALEMCNSMASDIVINLEMALEALTTRSQPGEDAVEREEIEWKEQHENLLSVRQSDLAVVLRWQELCRRTLAYLPSTLGITREIREALPPYNDDHVLAAALNAAALKEQSA